VAGYPALRHVAEAAGRGGPLWGEFSRAMHPCIDRRVACHCPQGCHQCTPAVNMLASSAGSQSANSSRLTPAESHHQQTSPISTSLPLAHPYRGATRCDWTSTAHAQAHTYPRACAHTDTRTRAHARVCTRAHWHTNTQTHWDTRNYAHCIARPSERLGI